MIASRRRVASSLVAAVVLAVTMSACTDDPGAAEPGHGNPNASSPHSSAPTTSASPADMASKKALAAYTGMWDDMVQAAETSNWEDPQLGRHATKDALRVITGLLFADHKNGVVTKGKPTYDPEVTSVKPTGDPTTVMIADCGDDRRWLKHWKKNGKRVDDEPGGLRRILAEAKLQSDGEWRVTRFAVQGVGTCTR